MKTNHFIAAVYVLLAFFVVACGGGGGGGSAPASNNSGPGQTNPPAAGSEGTQNNPVVITAQGMPYSGKVAVSGPSYYLISGLTAGATYSVTFGNVAGSIIPSLYSSSTMSVSQGQSCFYSAVTADASCIVPASSSGTIYISTVNYSLSGASTYSISASLAVDSGQGTPTIPVAIASPSSYSGMLTSGVSTTPYDSGNSGYYSITGLIPGHQYYFYLNGLSVGADLYVSQNSFASPSCVSKMSGTTSEFCTLIAKYNSVLVRVEAKDQGSFTLSYVDNGVAPVFATDGSIGAEMPLVLDEYGSLTNGSVNETKSYYTVSGLVPGLSYTTYLNLPGDNVDLYVYRDGAYTNLACSSTQSGRLDESCSAVPDAKGQLWIVVDGASATTYLGSVYTIGVQRVAPVQGTSAQPIIVNAMTELPYRVSGTKQSSYYKITGLAANTAYMASITTSRTVGLSPQMALHPSTGFGHPLLAPCTTTSSDINCSGNTDASGALYVTIDVGNVAGGTAYLNVSTVPVSSEGAATAPLAKDMAALTNKFSGQVVAGSDSYYALSGLAANTPYYIRASFGGGQSAGIYVYTTFSGNLSTQAYVSGVDCSSSWTRLNNGCTATSDASGRLWVRIWPFSNAGTTFTLEALPAPVSQGTSIAPLDITAGMPYRATVGSDSSSYYMVTGLVAGNEYLFSKLGTSGGERLYVYNDIGLTQMVCMRGYPSDGPDEVCRGKPTGSVVYINVSNTGYMTAPSYYSLDVAPVPPAEGTAALPKAVSSGNTGSVNVGVSYYQASLAANTTYTVSLTGVTGDPDLYVFNNSAMTGAASCSSIKGSNQVESCQATSDANGKLWIVVDGELSKGGGSYTINIQ